MPSYKNIIILYNIITNFKKPSLELRFKRRKGITRSKFEWKCIPNRRCGNSKRPTTIKLKLRNSHCITIYSQSLEKTHLECVKPLKNGILFLNLNSDNHGQKSWDKFTFVALFQTRQTNSHARIHLHLVSPPPPSPPPTMLDTCTRYFSRVSTLYGGGGGGGGKVTQFKTDNSAFFKHRFENTEN